MIIDLKKCTLKIVDGDGTPNELEIKLGEGNITFSEKQTMEYILDKGLLDEVREGDQVPMDVSLNAVWEYMTGRTTVTDSETIRDALTKTGECAGWVSTDTDACRPYAVDLVIEYVPTPTTCGDKETITFPDFRLESFDGDLRGGSFSIAGKCNVTKATVVRAENT